MTNLLSNYVEHDKTHKKYHKGKSPMKCPQKRIYKIRRKETMEILLVITFLINTIYAVIPAKNIGCEALISAIDITFAYKVIRGLYG